jgi:hypothetical protein
MGNNDATVLRKLNALAPGAQIENAKIAIEKKQRAIASDVKVKQQILDQSLALVKLLADDGWEEAAKWHEEAIVKLADVNKIEREIAELELYSKKLVESVKGAKAGGSKDIHLQTAQVKIRRATELLEAIFAINAEVDELSKIAYNIEHAKAESTTLKAEREKLAAEIQQLETLLTPIVCEQCSRLCYNNGECKI